MVKVLKETLPNGVIKILAKDREEVVGSLFVDPSDLDEGFGPLQVNPTHRKKGIGTKLLKQAQDLFPVQGKFKPDTGMEAAVRNFYEKNGYAIDKNNKLVKI